MPLGKPLPLPGWKGGYLLSLPSSNGGGSFLSLFVIVESSLVGPFCESSSDSIFISSTRRLVFAWCWRSSYFILKPFGHIRLQRQFYKNNDNILQQQYCQNCNVFLSNTKLPFMQTETTDQPYVMLTRVMYTTGVFTFINQSTRCSLIVYPLPGTEKTSINESSRGVSPSCRGQRCSCARCGVCPEQCVAGVNRVRIWHDCVDGSPLGIPV